ncbi:MAG TPA: DUF2723 domain-containing protein [Herpetosiphonaceae bacterium]
MGGVAGQATIRRRAARRYDAIIFIGVLLLALLLYVATLLPGIGSQDTPEFQRVAPTLGVAHPTGYPLYTLLGWLWTRLPLGGTPAWRMNLLSAVLAALAVGVLYACSRAMDHRRTLGVAIALSLAATFTFWSQATITEVYALATLLQVALIWALLCWRSGDAPLWLVGLLLGLGLAHHRLITLMVPGMLLFVLLSRRLGLREVAAALAAILAPCLLYLYLPLRAPAWVDRSDFLWEYATARSWAGTLLNFAHLREEGSARLLYLVRYFIWPQFLPVGALLALIGGLRLIRRDRALAALLISTYGFVFIFCAAYYVNDVEIFLLPAHVIAALLLGEGSMAVVSRLPRWAGTAVSTCLLALPVVLVSRNVQPIRSMNTDSAEVIVREIMAQPLPTSAVVIVDWSYFEGLRYLQDVEGQRRDLELILSFNYDEHHQIIHDRIAQGRSVFLLRPWPNLGIDQWPQGMLWKVGDTPPTGQVATAATIQWSEGIKLTEYVLMPGPYQPGQIVPLKLTWEINGRPRQRYTLFVHLVAADGSKWGQQDADAPTDQWQPGEQHSELYGPVLSPHVPPGRYQIVIGWYNQRKLERLPLEQNSETAEARDYVILGEIEVTPRR